ncbi:MAG: hypothetical protein NVS4B11_18310 [Ktedonobacteraceae bacterium]
MKDVSLEVREKFSTLGVKYTQQLLEQGKTESQREELAQQLGISQRALTELVGRADMMRLHGIGGDLSLLLKEAGILSCKALSEQNVERLHKRLAELHIGQRIAYHAPSRAQVRSWINEAHQLAETSPDL